MKDKIIERLNEALDSNFSNRIYEDHVKDKLNSKIIKLNVEDISFGVCLNFGKDKISISENSDHIDVEISGTLTSFIFYTLSGGSDLFSSKITISGDVESANTLNSFLKESDLLRIIIVELIGQKTSSALFSVLDPMKDKLKESSDVDHESISNFLKYDIELVPTKQEIDSYIDEIDDIKSRTEKLIKKIK